MTPVGGVSHPGGVREVSKDVVLSVLLLGAGAVSFIGSVRPAAADSPVLLYAVTNGTGGAPCTSEPANCDLSTALSEANSDNDGDTVYLVGTTPFVGNWTISGSATIEPAPGQATATLDGNAGNNNSTCTTDETCDGPVLTISGETDDVTDLVVQNAYDLQNGGTGGGGIYEDNGSNLTVTGDTLTDDDSDVGGGGIGTVGSGTVQITDSTFENDNAIGDPGGGVLLNGVSATISGSSFIDDNAGTSGGAILSDIGSVEIGDSTFYDNSAGDIGGAIYAWVDDSLAVASSTFSANSAPNGDGPDLAAYSQNTPQTVSVAGDIFSDGCVQLEGENATWDDLGYNAGVDSSCMSPGPPGDLVSSSVANLAPLAYNGGPTETVVPEATNLAIGLVPVNSYVVLNAESVSLCPTTDQRGVPSISGDACNPGAVQDGSPTLDVSAPASQTASYDQSPDLTPGYVGFIASEGPSSLGTQATCAVDELNTTTPVTQSPVPPGNYTVNCSGAANSTADTSTNPDTNYTFSYTSGALTVEEPTVPTNMSPPTISGTLTSGQEAVRAPGSWIGPKPFTFKFQWERCAGPSVSDHCRSISGATNANYYVLTNADVGKYITVMVTATDSTGGKGYATAVPVGPVTKRDVTGR
jgi:hypothetical protein